MEIHRKMAGRMRVLAVFAASAAVVVLCSEASARKRGRHTEKTQGQGAGAAKPVVVQPGAPGEPSKTLPASTKGTLPPRSKADAEFMQGMILHHAQAVEMTALIDSHTENKELRSLGARINSSQADEIKFMKRWLASRGEKASLETAKREKEQEKDNAEAQGTQSGAEEPRTNGSHANHPMAAMAGMDMSQDGMALMPGMLTAKQMEALRKAKGAEFDRLFLRGMIQHHDGALTMVKDLFDTAGAGQDAELFGFATDVDTGQRAEIKIMQEMLEKKASGETKEEKR
ncbi:MAG TPA: DUF305 domain-containing protein [Candidatus Acidoferrum sp.]|nr:DUF305 domain-containing protein [Candidatus Acidoferrum sp.]